MTIAYKSMPLPFFVILLVVMMFSCAPNRPDISPLYSDAHFSTLGSYMEVYYYINRKQRSRINGELISVENNKIILRVIDKINNSKNNPKFELVSIPKTEIIRYNLVFAKENVGDFRSGASLITISHGFWMVFTLPINLITFYSIDRNSFYEFAYTQKNLKFSELKNYARFPQGLPADMDLNLILKPSKTIDSGAVGILKN